MRMFIVMIMMIIAMYPSPYFTLPMGVLKVAVIWWTEGFIECNSEREKAMKFSGQFCTVVLQCFVLLCSVLLCFALLFFSVFCTAVLPCFALLCYAPIWGIGHHKLHCMAVLNHRCIKANIVFASNLKWFTRRIMWTGVPPIIKTMIADFKKPKRSALYIYEDNAWIFVTFANISLPTPNIRYPIEKQGQYIEHLNICDQFQYFVSHREKKMPLPYPHHFQYHTAKRTNRTFTFIKWFSLCPKNLTSAMLTGAILNLSGELFDCELIFWSRGERGVGWKGQLDRNSIKLWNMKENSLSTWKLNSRYGQIKVDCLGQNIQTSQIKAKFKIDGQTKGEKGQKTRIESKLIGEEEYLRCSLCLLLSQWKPER